MKNTTGEAIEWESAWDMLEKKQTELDDAHAKIRKLEDDLNEAIKDKYEWKSVAEGDLLGTLDKLSGANRKIEQQAHRIRFLEGATNHAGGTPLRKMKEQRDRLAEALRKIDNARLNQFAGPHDMALTCVLIARETLAAWKGGQP
jgi:chromosome segregation ATPase